LRFRLFNDFRRFFCLQFNTLSFLNCYLFLWCFYPFLRRVLFETTLSLDRLSLWNFGGWDRILISSKRCFHIKWSLLLILFDLLNHASLILLSLLDHIPDKFFFTLQMTLYLLIDRVQFAQILLLLLIHLLLQLVFSLLCQFAHLLPDRFLKSQV